MRLTAALLFCCSAAAATAPHVDFATFLGGSGDDQPTSIAVDSAGFLYVAGYTDSSDFPFTSVAFGSPSTQRCTFVAKLNPGATSIVWSVCLPGVLGGKVVPAANGNVFVLVNQTVTVLAADASRILYSVPVPFAIDMAVDSAGNAYVAGAASGGLATTRGAYQTLLAPGNCPDKFGNPAPCSDAVVMKLNPQGAVVYATYLGGSGTDWANGIGVDSKGDAWITGNTLSPNLPVTGNAWEPVFHGVVNLGPSQSGDSFAAELDPNGEKLLYSSYIGGSAYENAAAIAVDAAGAAYVIGSTQSPDFPTTQGAVQRTFVSNATGGTDAFVMKFAASGAVVYATYLGGPRSAGTKIAADPQGNAWVDYNPNIFQSPAGTPANYTSLAQLNADGSAILHTLPMEGGLALDSSGSIYLSFATYGYVFFPTPGVLQPAFRGGVHDVALLKLEFAGAPSPWVSTILNAAGQRTGTPQYYPVFEVAPGELIEVFGWGFDANTRILFDGIPAPVFYTSANQINAVVPFEVAGPTTSITIEGAGQTLGPGIENVFDAVPALFTLDGSGLGAAAVVNQDGSVNSAINPAPRGSIVAVFLTGAGRMSPPLADGAINPLFPPYPSPLLPVSSSLGDVVFDGAAPGMIAGVVQANIRISTTAVFHNPAPFVVIVGNFASGLLGDTTIYVQ